MRKAVSIFLFFSFCSVSGVFGQLTIEECYRKAKENYPLAKRYGLIEQAKGYNIANANKGYLPQLSLSAKATYQSEVTTVPISLPGVDIKGPDKDQYQALLELSQTIWDGGVIRSQKKITEASSEADRQSLEVDMYALNERVNQLFFGILLLEEQLKQNLLLQSDLKRNYGQVESYVVNGIANQADLDAVRVNQLSAKQSETELRSNILAYREMLSALTGGNAREGVSLLEPEIESMPPSGVIRRPELQLFGARESILEQQRKMLASKNLPRLGLFAQGGYGNPGLNMLKNDFSAYYVAGVRLSWNFGGLYTKKDERRLLDNSRESLGVQKETFLFNTGLEVTKEERELNKLRELMRDDDEIISLRTNIRKAAEIKVANGTLSVTELLREVNAEDMARQNKVLHKMQLLKSYYDLKNTVN